MATKPRKAPRKPPGRGSRLTPKQARFAQEYLIDMNGAQAAIRSGYSAKTAKEIAARLLTNVNVSSALEKARASLAARTEITQERVLKELARMGFSDVRSIFTPDGGLRSPTEMNDEEAAAIQSVKVITRRVPGNEKHVEQVHEIKMADKLGALTQIGRHLGMFTDKSEVDVKGAMNVNFAPDESNF